MRRIAALVLLSLACPFLVLAQDERQVRSPDGQIEFRIFLTRPPAEPHERIAYQVDYRGQRLINTSFLGLEIHDQPLLGENAGLTSAKTGATGAYQWLTAEYMQNGSLGRRITVEVRAYNDGIAFRYVLPWSGPLQHFFLENEATEFELVRDAAGIQRITEESVAPLPFVVEQPGAGWISIGEVPTGKYPRASLGRTEGRVLITRLPQKIEPFSMAMEASAPMTGPWRVLAIGPTREQAAES